MEYIVEKGVQIPSRAKYPFGKMEVGDSFEFPFAERNKIRHAMNKYAKEHGTAKFEIHNNRIWRVATSPVLVRRKRKAKAVAGEQTAPVN